MLYLVSIVISFVLFKTYQFIKTKRKVAYLKRTVRLNDRMHTNEGMSEVVCSWNEKEVQLIPADIKAKFDMDNHMHVASIEIAKWKDVNCNLSQKKRDSENNFEALKSKVKVNS